jgi:hypothetical protein
MRVGGGAPQSMARGAHLAAAFPDYWAAALFGTRRRDRRIGRRCGWRRDWSGDDTKAIPRMA